MRADTDERHSDGRPEKCSVTSAIGKLPPVQTIATWQSEPIYRRNERLNEAPVDWT